MRESLLYELLEITLKALNLIGHLNDFGDPGIELSFLNCIIGAL